MHDVIIVINFKFFFAKQRLKAAFHFTVGKIGEDRGTELEVRFGRTIVAAITELAVGHLKTVAEDLEAFAK